MKRTQGKDVVGYVTAKVSGKNPEFFFQACANVNIPVWDMKKVKPEQCNGKIYLHHMKDVSAIAKELQYEVDFSNRKGFFSYLLYLWTRKEIIISILLCSIIIFIMSNIVWKIDVSGVSTDVEKKINKELINFGLYEGSWAYTLKPLDIIQQDILNKIPELQYIGIQKKGTTYHIDGVEKLVIEEREETPTRHLVAAKNGIVQKMFIKQGLPVVEVNDFVNKGDLLVSGSINKELENSEKELESIEEELVAADGEVYANTWYSVNVTSGLYRSHEKLSGEKKTKNYLMVGNIRIPIWGFQKVPFEKTYIETEKKQINILNWETPVHFIDEDIYNKDSFTQVQTIEEAKENAINHVKSDLLLKLGTDVEILKYYVLHESVDNGKVKLKLYISVLENIAIGNPIH